MGTATFTRSTGKQPQRVAYGRREVRGTITMSDSYATGGDTLAMTSVPFDHVTDLIVEGGSLATSEDGYQFKLAGTSVAPKIKAFNSSGEVSNATDLDEVSLVVRLVGY